MASSASSISSLDTHFELLDHDFLSLPESESDASSIGDDDSLDSLIRGGLTSAHLDLIASRNWKAVLGWIAFHADEVSTLVDREGHTALHHACLFRAPLDVIEAMMFAAPELATFGNDAGELALHWAVRLALSSQVLKILLQANPNSGFAKDSQGVTPLSLLWDRHEDTLTDVFRVYGRDSVTSRPSWNWIMMMVEAYSKVPDIKAFPLHAIVQSPCEPPFLEFAIQLWGDAIHQCDHDGQLPLHLACRAPEEPLLLSMVLNAYPGAASTADNTGCLPLHLAIASGKKWNDELVLIFQADPTVLGKQNPQNGLYPFLQAACQENACLSTIYDLLRANPENARCR